MSKLLRLPIKIKPVFWLVASLIGFLNSSGNILHIILWVAVVFISVLVHECGHAFTALLFGLRSRIELIAFGGVTYHSGQKIALWKEFLITTNGPLFGLGLFFISQFLLSHVEIPSQAIQYFLMVTRNVNLIWTVLNLIPVIPLDGGNLLRIALESIFKEKGFQYALVASAIVGCVAALLCFIYGLMIAGMFFILMAFQNFETRSRFKNFSEYDQRADVKHILFEAQQNLKEGHKEEAQRDFERIRSEAKEGLSYALATQYLAYLKYEEGSLEESYQLLSSIHDKLSGDGLSLLHQVAFEMKDYQMVNKLSADAYQNWPDAETALRNAFAAAALHQTMPAIGWLKAALEKGAKNIHNIVQDEVFDNIRQDERFIHFLGKHS